jgi:hypothetical protein
MAFQIKVRPDLLDRKAILAHKVLRVLPVHKGPKAIPVLRVSQAHKVLKAIPVYKDRPDHKGLQVPQRAVGTQIS